MGVLGGETMQLQALQLASQCRAEDAAPAMQFGGDRQQVEFAPQRQAEDDLVQPLGDLLAVARQIDILAGRQLHQQRSEEHTSELQSLMRISYAVFCLKKKKQQTYI